MVDQQVSNRLQWPGGGDVYDERDWWMDKARDLQEEVMGLQMGGPPDRVVVVEHTAEPQADHEALLDAFEEFARHEEGCARYRVVGKTADGADLYGHDERFCSCGYREKRAALLAALTNRNPGPKLHTAAEELLGVLDVALIGAPDTGYGVRPCNSLPVMAAINALRTALKK